MSTYLAIDLGTSNCRSAVFDESINMLSIASKEYPLINISAAEIEQEPLLWWEAVKETIKAAISKAGRPASEVLSISISSQGIAFHPIDAEGNPLYNSISWLDMRAPAEEAEIEKKYGIPGIFDITGKRANGCYTLSKLVKFQADHPDLVNNAYKILLPMDYIQFMLCGNAITDHTMASGTMFYDINTQKWSDKILNDYSIDASKLPHIGWSGYEAGRLRPELAKELGLSEDVIVAIGAQDQKCAALGAGITNRCATVSLGTASCITMLSNAPVKDSLFRIPCFSYLWPDTWSYEGIINTAASSYQWFRTNFAPGYSYPQLNDLAAAAAKKGERAFFFPYLSGMTSPFWGTKAGGFDELSLASDVGQLALSIMDGVSCNIKANLDVMAESAGAPDTIRVFGGGSSSPLWCQILADITDTPVVTSKSPETALKGAAMLARHAVFSTFETEEDTGAVYEPISENAAVYREYYDKYMSKLKGTY